MAKKQQPITAIRILRQIDINHRKEKYPNARYYYEDKSINDNSANGIMKCIEKFHSFIGGVAERIHTQGRKVDNRKTVVTATGFNQTIGSVGYILTTGRKGSADMSITFNAVNVKCEVKYGKDRQSEEQKKYQQDIEAAGGIYIIVKSFHDYLVWFGSKYGRHPMVAQAITELTPKKNS